MQARQKADALLSSDKFEKAIGMYQAAANIKPDDDTHCANCHNGKGVALGLSGDWQNAWVEWDAAAQLKPDEPAYLHYRGVASLKLKNFSAAEADLTTARDLGHPRSADQLKECQAQRRQHAAETAFVKGKELWNESEAVTQSATAKGAEAAGKLRASKLATKALAEFREAARMGYPNAAAIHIMNTFCLTKCERWSEALAESKKALELVNDVSSDEETFSFQGLDRERLVKMAVSLAKLAKAQEAAK